MDFSDYRDDLDSKENHQRFFAGIPNIPKKKKNLMAIYLLFFQHIIHSLSNKGKAAVVIPTGFLSAKQGIEPVIKKYLIDNELITGVINMPSNISNTGTNVSIILTKRKNKEIIFLMLLS